MKLHDRYKHEFFLPPHYWRLEAGVHNYMDAKDYIPSGSTKPGPVFYPAMPTLHHRETGKTIEQTLDGE